MGAGDVYVGEVRGVCFWERFEGFEIVGGVGGKGNVSVSVRVKGRTVKVEINFHYGSMRCCDKGLEKLSVCDGNLWPLSPKTEPEGVDDSYLCCG